MVTFYYFNALSFLLNNLLIITLICREQIGKPYFRIEFYD